MDIVLIGYGKMGKAIEEVALERGHSIVLKIQSDNQSAFTESNLQMADMAFEFTEPEVALNNVLQCLTYGLPVVCGTTGWDSQIEKARQKCLDMEGSFLQTFNFSIGVNLFFEVNRYLATLMENHPNYNVRIEETHHTEKKDKPSGTAITLAKQILERLSRKKQWQLEVSAPDAGTIPVEAIRKEGVAGTHVVKYFSEIDDIEIKHIAHSRKGFALGAVLAAEFIYKRHGIFSMQDVLSGIDFH